MKYLRLSLLETLDEKRFQEAKQFPWMDIPNFLDKNAYQELVANMPDIANFEKTHNKPRAYGQLPHNRYTLEYRKGLNIPSCWESFISELKSKEYKSYLKRMFNIKNFDLRFHWHYSEGGGSISPHCDGENKVGSQLFYFNTSENWSKEWGGQTLVLMDKYGKHKCESAPDFSDFDEFFKAKSVDNNSFIFARTSMSWHGVQEITAPEGKFRKIFVVVIDKSSLYKKIKNIFVKQTGY